MPEIKDLPLVAATSINDNRFLLDTFLSAYDTKKSKTGKISLSDVFTYGLSKLDRVDIYTLIDAIIQNSFFNIPVVGSIKNKFYKGNNPSSLEVNEFRSNIANSRFKKVFLGDFYETADLRWIVSDFNYFINTPWYYNLPHVILIGIPKDFSVKYTYDDNIAYMNEARLQANEYFGGLKPLTYTMENNEHILTDEISSLSIAQILGYSPSAAVLNTSFNRQLSILKLVNFSSLTYDMPMMEQNTLFWLYDTNDSGGYCMDVLGGIKAVPFNTQACRLVTVCI